MKGTDFKGDGGEGRPGEPGGHAGGVFEAGSLTQAWLVCNAAASM